MSFNFKKGVSDVDRNRLWVFDTFSPNYIIIYDYQSEHVRKELKHLQLSEDFSVNPHSGLFFPEYFSKNFFLCSASHCREADSGKSAIYSIERR